MPGETMIVSTTASGTTALAAASRVTPSRLLPSWYLRGHDAPPMATLPGLPQTDEPEPDALPVEPDDSTSIPGRLPEEAPGHHEPVELPKA